MNLVVNFIIESGISLSFFGLFYYLFLRKETFFLQNRIFLFVAVVFSVVLPLLHIRIYEPKVIQLPVVTVTPDSSFLYAVTIYGQGFSKKLEQTIFSAEIVLWIYAIGVLFFALRFLYRYLQIRHIKSKGKLFFIDNVEVVRTDESMAPFSFLNTIFIPQNLEDKEGYQQIILHEMEHVKQRHSYDILILEILTIIQWCNPFAWLLMRAVHENHEYLADKAVLATGAERGSYKLLLLNQCLGDTIFIGSPFNYSLIKNRIKMMNKIKSPRIANLKYLLSVFVAVGLIVAFAYENKLTAMETQLPEIAEKSIPQSKEKRVFVRVEQMPAFPGGDKKLMEFIGENVKYPKEAVAQNIEGTVYLKFVIMKTGEVGDVQVLRSPHDLLTDEAIRVVKMLPKFKPGMQRGQAVDVWYQLPIKFANVSSKEKDVENEK